ncbi:MAG: metal ABC transporter ATP-binding protein [Candidatus Poseidoniaceae archaeon]
MQQNEPLLEIKNLSIGFNSALVTDIIARVLPGEIIAVLGPSGIGKTTLIRTIAGLIQPLEGQINLSIPKQGGMGYIPQRLGLVRHASVHHNVNLGARASLPILKGESQEREKRVHEAIKAMGLEEKTNEPVRRLSGGQLRRVATARALAQRPKLLLADEFLSELDHATVEVVLDAVKNLLDDGTSIIMVEHHEENVELLATRIWLIEDETFSDMTIEEWRNRGGEDE